MAGAYNLVEGVWNNFVFKKIERSDYDEVLDHCSKYFLRDEPICQLLGWTQEFDTEMREVIRLILEDGISFLALDATNSKLASVRITFNSKTVPLNDLEVKEVQTEALLNGIEVEEGLKHEVMQKHGVDSYAEFFIASTHPLYRNQGLASELRLRSLPFLKAQGYKLAKCIFTSPISRRAGEKLGFTEISRLYFKDILKKNGELLFCEMDLNQDHFAAAMIKTL